MVSRSRPPASLRPLLAVTLGDPAGIGPWTAAAAALDPGLRRLCRPLLVGDAWVARRCGARVLPLADPDEYIDRPGVLNVLHAPHPRIRELVPGRPQKIGGESASLSVQIAASLAMQGRVAAVVTGPVSKESFRLAGVPFPGHTELLAALSGVARSEMLMAAGRLLALLITRHVPLSAVPRRLTVKAISDSVRSADAWLKRALGTGRRPQWALCGLNPHAGDNGLLGREEISTVAPAAAALRKLGVDIAGPLPADVAWGKHAAGSFDAVACLYHDQGMIPLKASRAGPVVNITAGLPWTRTSPGHGTAFDLAAAPRPGRRADPAATIAAAHWALRVAENFRPRGGAARPGRPPRAAGKRSAR
ncbi:MAG: PdxA family dehydrogenase [Elusimicrobiota bacterium]